MLYWPGSSKNNTTFVCVHALGLSAKAFSGFGDTMSRKGFEVYAFDVRGFGSERDRPGYNRLDLDTTVADLKDVISLIRSRDRNRKIIVFGESMGGAIVLKATSQYPRLMDAVVLSAPAWQLYNLKRITMKGIGDLFLPDSCNMAARSVMKQATSSAELKRYWREDKSHKLKLSPREAYDYYKFIRLTPQYSEKVTSTPVLVFQGLHDNLAKPTATARLFKMIKSRDKQFVIACDAEHLVLEEGQLSKTVIDITLKWVSKLTNHKTGAGKSRVVVLDRESLEVKDLNQVNRLMKLSGAPQPKLSITPLPGA